MVRIFLYLLSCKSFEFNLLYFSAKDNILLPVSVTSKNEDNCLIEPNKIDNSNDHLILLVQVDFLICDP